MNDETQSSLSEPPPLWRYIPLDQFTRPKSSAKEVVRKGLVGLLDKVWRQAPQSGEPVVAQDNLCRAPDSLLDKIAPAPDWSELVTALDGVLQDWLAALMNYKSLNHGHFSRFVSRR